MKLNQEIKTKDQLLVSMTCWEFETVLKYMNSTREADMKI